jgi:hypothetical protein
VTPLIKLLLKLAPISLGDLTPLVPSLRLYAEFRAAHGMAETAPALLTHPQHNVKLAKDSGAYGLSLAPARLSGHNTCPHSTPECRKACLNTAGKGPLQKVQDGRIIKTQFLASHPLEFLSILHNEVRLMAKRECVDHGAMVAPLRLNVFSDIPWERIIEPLMHVWVSAGVRLYDYTKWSPTDRPASPLYDLTYSASERHTIEDIRAMVAAGHRVAVPVDATPSTPMPCSWHDMMAVDGDKSDLRFLEPKRCVVLLRAKGVARSLKAGESHFIKSLESNLA